MAFESLTASLSNLLSQTLPEPPPLTYGEPDTESSDIGLYGPGSMTWKIHSHPVAAIAGVRALMMQALHPVAMRGVAAHSAYKTDPWGRLSRTAEFVSVASFATSKEATDAGLQVQRVHERLGVDAPDLLRWVHIAFVNSLIEVYLLVEELTEEQKDLYVYEQRKFATLVGLDENEVPHSYSQMNLYLETMKPMLYASPEARDAVKFIVAPPMSTEVKMLTPAVPLWFGLAATAFATLPRWAREEFGDGAVGVALAGLPLIDTLQTKLAVNAWSKALSNLPEDLRKNPWMKACEVRLGQSIS
ncbi:MAG: hypothetical protein RIS09_656 [Actinomycetota bacterium]|jgi:uncharacterized protein (DUF2236 family)